MSARPATKARELELNAELPPPREPSEHALRLAKTLNERLKGRAAKIRFDFIRHEAGGLPPVASLLRGGRGGDVRLKLLLSLLWVAGGGSDQRHSTNAYPARAWAGLLDLPEPEGNGQRRIRDAIGWLEEEGFVRTMRAPGRPMALQLMREDGSGRPYSDPAAAAKRKKKSGAAITSSDLYIGLPAPFWTDGWLVTLSGRAIAMLLVIAHVTFSERDEWPWVSPARARKLYGVSEDTWSKGIAELRARGIIQVRKRPVGEDDFDFRRVRNTYKLRREGRQLVLPTVSAPLSALRGPV